MKNAKLEKKKRNGLSEQEQKKKKKPAEKRGFWGSMFASDASAMAKRRAALDDALNY